MESAFDTVVGVGAVTRERLGPCLAAARSQLFGNAELRSEMVFASTEFIFVAAAGLLSYYLAISSSMGWLCRVGAKALLPEVPAAANTTACDTGCGLMNGKGCRS